MADALDKATILRNQALARRAKSSNRVSSTVLRSLIVEFLNSDASYMENIDDNYPSLKPASLYARIRAIVVEDKLDELVYPIVQDGKNVTLVKLVEAD